MVNGPGMNASIRCGTDLVEISRIRRAADRLGRRFLDRIFSPEEIDDCLPDGHWREASAASLAARFAAKEAVAKALGTGIWRQGITWTDIVVRRQPDGAPMIELSGSAWSVFQQIGGFDLAISLTHERDLAMAFCVIQCRPDGERQADHG